eukprot:gene15474-18321_t
MMGEARAALRRAKDLTAQAEALEQNPPEARRPAAGAQVTQPAHTALHPGSAIDAQAGDLLTGDFGDINVSDDADAEVLAQLRLLEAEHAPKAGGAEPVITDDTDLELPGAELTEEDLLDPELLAQLQQLEGGEPEEDAGEAHGEAPPSAEEVQAEIARLKEQAMVLKRAGDMAEAEMPVVDVACGGTDEAGLDGASTWKQLEARAQTVEELEAEAGAMKLQVRVAVCVMIFLSIFQNSGMSKKSHQHHINGDGCRNRPDPMMNKPMLLNEMMAGTKITSFAYCWISVPMLVELTFSQWLLPSAQ